MFMVLSSWQSHCESSPGSFDECRTVPSGRRPKTKPDDLGCESACTGCQNLHPPSPFIIITQPESWYSFYRLTEAEGWVDLAGWLHTKMVYPSTDGHPSFLFLFYQLSTLPVFAFCKWKPIIFVFIIIAILKYYWSVLQYIKFTISGHIIMPGNGWRKCHIFLRKVIVGRTH